MSTEANFVISYNFTTVRGDTYEEFVQNCISAFGPQDGQNVAVVAMAELRNHFLGAPTVEQAAQTITNTLGATAVQQPAVQQQYQPVPQPGFAPRPVPTAPQPAVGIDYPGDCVHGPRKYVAAGVSRSTGKAYTAFYACQAPQGQQKCRG